MPGELNNALVTRSPTTLVTCPSSARMRIHVSSTPSGTASVQYRLGYGGHGGAVDYTSVLSNWREIPPGSYSFDESQKPFDGVELRSASATVPVSISLDCIPG